MPSREHFLLKRRRALSKDSFSPTLIVDIFTPPLPSAFIFILQDYTKLFFHCQAQNVLFRPFFSKFEKPPFLAWQKTTLPCSRTGPNPFFHPKEREYEGAERFDKRRLLGLSRFYTRFQAPIRLLVRVSF